jgi:bidirectional [NiFe] hydrogenase diaphorase subunit
VPILTPPPLHSDDKRWNIEERNHAENGFVCDVPIETLYTVQSSLGYLEDDSIPFVAKSHCLPLSIKCRVW